MACKKSFSTRTLSPTFGQKRVDLNVQIFKLATSGIALREIARLLNCNYKTVYYKFKWLGPRAKEFHKNQHFNSKEVFFDEMESIEHTKLKPLTIALAVNEHYQLLGVQVGSIPAKGHLANIAYRKYGYRANESSDKINELLLSIRSKVESIQEIKSDAKPLYKNLVKNIFPNVPYKQFTSRDNKEKRREQKYLSSEKRIHDPLFPLNHTCAVLRDHIKRLARKSWCTSKIKEHLELNIYLYIAKLNQYRFM
ncbi:putative transposase [Bdellovibrio bacteriovorus W]|nr:putative transposase [Bdellovibrio bacteriovorus W]